MTKRELNSAVARATGENLHTIVMRGFSIADPPTVDYDPEPPRRPRMVNWDAVDARRTGILPCRRAR
ncbi:MAG: hypothetical protein ACOY3P_14420 [Planctomycetota bacterium]